MMIAVSLSLVVLRLWLAEPAAALGIWMRDAKGVGVLAAMHAPDWNSMAANGASAAPAIYAIGVAATALAIWRVMRTALHSLSQAVPAGSPASGWSETS